MNYYELLEVNLNSSPEVIRASYKALSKKYHPDNYGDDGSMMKMLNEAYDVLSDLEKRKKYDMQMGIYEQTDNREKKADVNILGDTIGEKILSIILGVGYLIFQVVYIAWGIAVLLLIIGFFTGHSQALFGKLFDWILSFIN